MLIIVNSIGIIELFQWVSIWFFMYTHICWFVYVCFKLVSSIGDWYLIYLMHIYMFMLDL